MNKALFDLLANTPCHKILSNHEYFSNLDSKDIRSQISGTSEFPDFERVYIEN